MTKPSLKFLLPPQFKSYDLSKPPSLSNYGAGVGVKYARAEEIGKESQQPVRQSLTGTGVDVSQRFLGSRISAVDEIDSDDVVLADWLWFCSCEGTDLISQVKSFVEIDNPKIIYGSELCVLGWPRDLTRKLIESADLITHNTEYQQNLYEILGVYNSRLLCDPVPEYLFSPSPHKVRRLVCMGQISPSKRSGAVVELFEALKNSDVETLYIGGNMVWANRTQDKASGSLHRQIKSLSDTFVENASQSEIADIINGSAYYAHVSHHDVASSSCQENMMAGNILFGLTHPMLRERTNYRFEDIELLAQAIADYPFQSEQHQSDIKKMTATASQWSYAEFQNQLLDILRVVL